MNRSNLTRKQDRLWVFFHIDTRARWVAILISMGIGALVGVVSSLMVSAGHPIALDIAATIVMFWLCVIWYVSHE